MWHQKHAAVKWSMVVLSLEFVEGFKPIRTVGSKIAPIDEPNADCLATPTSIVSIESDLTRQINFLNWCCRKQNLEQLN